MAEQSGQTQVTQAVIETQIEKTRQEGLVASKGVRSMADTLVIVDPAGYAYADSLLLKVRIAIETVDGKLDPIIKPIRSGLDQLYALKRELHAPLDAAETAIKGKMAAWQLAERKKIQEEERRKQEQEDLLRRKALAKQQEEARLKREAEEAEERAANARSSAARAMAEEEAKQLRRQQESAAQAASKLDVRADTAAAQQVTAKPKASGSSASDVKKWRVTSLMDVVSAVAEGTVPLSVLAIDQVAMNNYMKTHRNLVETWPGIEVYDDVRIAGRG